MRNALLSAMLLALVGCAPHNDAQQPKPKQKPVCLRDFPNYLLVRFNPELTPPEAAIRARQLGIEIEYSIPGRWEYLVRSTQPVTPLAKVISELRSQFGDLVYYVDYARDIPCEQVKHIPPHIQ